MAGEDRQPEMIPNPAHTTPTVGGMAPKELSNLIVEALLKTGLIIFLVSFSCEMVMSGLNAS